MELQETKKFLLSKENKHLADETILHNGRKSLATINLTSD
jgi:hypothetical protein